jgi:orc1/cdc6 family replication initiation protein
MIVDARVLQPEFVPREIVHRDRETRELSKVLKPILEDEPTESAFLFGPTGVGKTCIAQFATDRLQQQLVDLNVQYVNCWEDYTRFKTLYRILEGIDQSYDIHRQSTPRDELVERLREYDGYPYVVILDEVDQLEDTRVLYELYRVSGLSLVMIANREEELFAHLDSRVGSRLRNRVSIKFDRYRNHELVSILEDRVKWGLEPGSVSSDQLEQIAEAACGDARVGLGILRNAAKAAQEERVDEVSSEGVQSVIPEAKSEIERNVVERLNEDQRVLYDVITKHRTISPGELYEEYQYRVENPKTKRMIRNYLSKMDHYELIEVQGSTRGRVYKTASTPKSSL